MPSWSIMFWWSSAAVQFLGNGTSPVWPKTAVAKAKSNAADLMFKA
jgi:hypothetical protein